MLESGVNDEIESLRRLLHATKRLPGGSPARRRYVAEIAGCNPDNLYQVARGIRLKSGRPRALGRDVREKLDAAFPGWHAPPASATTPANMVMAPAPPPYFVPPPDLGAALDRLASALAAADPAASDAIASNLAGWAKAAGKGPWRDILLKLLK